MTAPCPCLLFLAQAGGPGDVNNIVSIAQYGVLGLVVLGFIVGWIWPKPSVERLLSENSRLQVQTEELAKTYQSEVIPTLVRANELLTRMAARLGESAESK